MSSWACSDYKGESESEERDKHAVYTVDMFIWCTNGLRLSLIRAALIYCVDVDDSIFRASADDIA